MTAFLHAQGFLGTKAKLGVDLTLVLMVAVAIILSVGYYFARQRNFKAHKWVQTAGVLLGLIVVSWMMILPFRDLVVKGLDNHPANAYYTSIVHGIIGIVATLFGIFVTLRGHKIMLKALRFKNYKLYMRVSYWLYIVATLLGIAAYITWYV